MIQPLRGAFLLPVALLAPAGWAQLSADRTYFGIDRPVPMHARAPEGAGELSIALHPPGSKPDDPATPRAKVAPGPVDLASAFPEYWKKHAGSLVYAQLYAGAEPLGPPVVLQPLTPPKVAVPQGNRISFIEQPTGLSGIRADVDKHVVLETTLGEIELRLRPDQAPNTCHNFRDLVAGGFYTDIQFHRIIGPDFMAQCGDPRGEGSGGPGRNIDLEDSKLPHDFGVVSMARTNDPNSGGSQFFLCFDRSRTAALDGRYCAFGQAVRGGDVIEKLARVEVVNNAQGEPSKPKDPPVLRRAGLVEAPPFGRAPEPVKRGAQIP